MSKPVPHVPHCVGCNRPQDEAPGMFSIRHGGMPIYLCFDCTDELHARAWLQRHQIGGFAINAVIDH